MMRLEGLNETHLKPYLSLWNRFVTDPEELKLYKQLAFYIYWGLGAVLYRREAQVCEPSSELVITKEHNDDKDRLYKYSSQYLHNFGLMTKRYVQRYHGD